MMLDIPTVASIVLASGSVICIFIFTVKAMHRNEVRVKTMSDEIEAIISEAAAGQSESLLPERVLLSAETPSAEPPEDTATMKTDATPETTQHQRNGKTSHERCASDFIPHQYRKEIAA